MLISITEVCRMGCLHCMDDAKPKGQHMSMETFQEAVNFFIRHDNSNFIMTGGEPTENPHFWEMVEYAAKRVPIVTVTTNGMNLVDNNDAYERINSLNKKYGEKILWQVTHVEKYYPQHINYFDKIFSLENVFLTTELEAIYPQGRARTNKLSWNSKGSKCFNIRSLARKFENFDLAIAGLKMKFKFCTPQIDIHGNIKLGESMLCPVASNIYKTPHKIVEDICNFKCSQCDIVNRRLPIQYLEAIGEK